MELLKMEGISKSFDGVPVLTDVGLVVGRGEIHALLGENGAGKSTLMNILAGTFAPDAGSVTLEGHDLTAAGIGQVEQAGVAFVHQELNLFNNLMAYENIFLGHELTGRLGRLRAREMVERTGELFERLGVDIDPKAMVADLKPGQKQLLEIARALFFDARLLILDEPTTALNTEEVDHLFSMVRLLRDEGASFIFISHKMPEVFELCDRYTVLRNGRLVASGSIAETTPLEVTGLMVGTSLERRGGYEPCESGEVTLRLSGLTGPGFSQVDLVARRSQVIGLTGLAGCGSSELMQCLFGIDRPWSGTLEACGTTLRGGSIHEAMRAGLAMLPANRKENSVVPDLSISENMALSEQVLSAWNFPVSPRAERRRFERYRDLLDIRAPGGDSPITSLSGGNQQKVFLARWLDTDAEIFLLDNPTQGIDVGAKAELYRLIRDLVRQGKTVLINTLEIPELQEVADVCLVFYEGRLAARLDHDEIDEHTVMMYSTNSLAGDEQANGGVS